MGAIALTQQKAQWRDSFQPDRANLTSSGRSAYFVLEPGYRLRLGKGKSTLTVTVLDETKVVDGVTTRIVEERETAGESLVEVSRNYFVIDKSNNDVYYFGEDVDIYRNGKVTSHEGSWLSGQNGARFGLLVPGKPRVGDKFYQEIAPKVAMDRAEIMTLTDQVKTPAGTFQNCLRTKETSGIERGAEAKWYAPGVGLIKDADFVLVGIDRR
jgi:hypothetical protein